MTPLDSVRKLDDERTAGEWMRVEGSVETEQVEWDLTRADVEYACASTSPEFGWRACAEALARAEARIAELERAGDALADALVWCSGSPSFAPEGEARLGWLRGPTLALDAWTATDNEGGAK